MEITLDCLDKIVSPKEGETWTNEEESTKQKSEEPKAKSF